jgi:tetratricopeptide (TPR) repeat protein
MRVYFLVLFSFALLTSGSLAQQPESGKKPVLIRDEVNKKRAEEPAEKILVHDPAQARKSVSIGDFYYKRDNFDAAASRYREAIDFDRQWPVSYEKLIKVLREQGKLSDALDVCELFVQENPDAKQVGKFQDLRHKIESDQDR